MYVNRRTIGSIALSIILLFASTSVLHFGNHLSAFALYSVNGKIAFASSRDGNFEIYTMDSDGTNEARVTNNDASDISPVWSPNGTKLAFVRGDSIHVMDADGKNIRRLTQTGLVSSDPSWSPDGGRILFAAITDGTDRDIYIMNATGGRATDITNNNSTDDFEPTWSPDGDKIAFTSSINASNFGIFVMNVNGTDRIKISGNQSSAQPDWSPDGTKIVFSGQSDRSLDIYSMEINGTNMVRLTRAGAEEVNPSWSPDGNKIVYTASHSSREQVYIMNADGTNAKRLTKNTFRDLSPDIQPLDLPVKESLPVLRDNGMILFSSNRNGTSAELYVMNPDGTNTTQLISSDNRIDSQAKWSPEGERIAYVSSRDGFHELLVINSNGTSQTVVHQNSAPFAGLDWSPEGDRLVFSKGDPFHRWVYVINTDGSGLKRLTDTDTIDSYPSWSPDGSKIAYARDFGEGNFEIYVMNPDGTNQKKITNNPASDNYPSWSPEGDQIAFVTNRDGNDEIYVMSSEGRAVKNLSNHTAMDLFPNWSPDGNQIIFVSDRNQDGQDIHVMDSDGKNPERLTTGGGVESDPDLGPLVGEAPAELQEIVEDPDPVTAEMPLNASSPAVRIAYSLPVAAVLVGQELAIAATLVNEDPENDLNTIAIVQVRDERGVTRHLDLVDGLVVAGGNLEASSLWVPSEAGSYELVLFVIDSEEDPRLLSASMRSQITVSDSQ